MGYQGRGEQVTASINDAEIVIIGGGVIGVSIAYHLAKSGCGDVALLEQSGLTQGATWHATDWKQVGSLRIASSAERWREIKRLATTARSFNFDLHLLSANEARDLFPLMSTDGVVGAAFIPGDGYIDPSSLTQSLARGARDGGVSIYEGVSVTGFVITGDRVTGVITDNGTMRCETLVIAAGMWSRDLGALCGVKVPAAAVEHQYLVTDVIDGATADLPTFRDPDNLFYMKPDAGGLAFGGWEPDTVPFGADGIPDKFYQQLLNADFDRFEQHFLSAASRVPALGEVGVRKLINGPIPVSADGEPIIGRAPERDNVYLACGFTAGIAAAGGAGQALAERIIHGDPGMDLWAFDVRRFGDHHAGGRYLVERALESYGRYYTLHIPTEYTAHVYERLWRAGQDYGIVNAGYRAIESLRLEKGYRYWGADISPDYTPYEAGLGFCVKLGVGDFMGRDALIAAKDSGPRRRLCCFTLAHEASVHGGEAILRQGKVLGVTTSGGYGHTLGKSIVYGYVDAENAGHDNYQIEVFGDSIDATRNDQTLYDPKRIKILG